MVPAGTPPGIVARLNREVVAVLNDPEMVASLGKQGLDTDPGTPEALAARIRDDVEKWRDIIRRAGIGSPVAMLLFSQRSPEREGSAAKRRGWGRCARRPHPARFARHPPRRGRDIATQKFAASLGDSCGADTDEPLGRSNIPLGSVSK